MRACAEGLCVWSRPFVCVCVYIYIYVNKKNRLFSALPLKNLLLSVTTACSLSLNASSVVCYVQQAAQSNSYFFKEDVEAPPLAPKYFLMSFDSTPHPLGYTVARTAVGSAVVPSVVCSHQRVFYSWQCSMCTGCVFCGTLVCLCAPLMLNVNQCILGILYF